MNIYFIKVLNYLYELFLHLVASFTIFICEQNPKNSACIFICELSLYNFG